ncbi:hypothetical protein Pmani_029130 [Petrolisthes manimaculis]|uniref:Uncharacterized protein n=1 Tax=Petrolisthes manimaculis TaxID=1843537 RepID=A0AAE1NYN0_9EUCA|nr:hypothetical protein Pmani_029130 [Petrolisthes manimaculis]
MVLLGCVLLPSPTNAMNTTPNPDDSCGGLYATRGYLTPWLTPAIKSLSHILTSRQSLYNFYVDLLMATPDHHDDESGDGGGWGETRWPLDSESPVAREGEDGEAGGEESGGGQGLPVWLQQALQILPPGVQCNVMTPDAKGVLQKYRSEEAGIGSLSSDDSSSSHHHLHPVPTPVVHTQT